MYICKYCLSLLIHSSQLPETLINCFIESLLTSNLHTRPHPYCPKNLHGFSLCKGFSSKSFSWHMNVSAPSYLPYFLPDPFHRHAPFCSLCTAHVPQNQTPSLGWLLQFWPLSHHIESASLLYPLFRYDHDMIVLLLYHRCYFTRLCTVRVRFSVVY